MIFVQIFIILFVFIAIFVILKLKKNNSILSAPFSKIQRRSADVGIDDTTPISGMIGLPIRFEFSPDAFAFIQNPESSNYFICNSSNVFINPVSSEIKFSLMLEKSSKVKIFSMTFGFYYNDIYDSELQNIKQIPCHLIYSLSNDIVYNCNSKLLPIINLSNSDYKSLAEIFIEMPEEGLIFDSSITMTLVISKSIKDIPKVCLNKIFAYELLPDIQEKDSYGNPLYPIIKKISGDFS